MFTNKTPTDKKGCIKRGLQDGNCLPASRFREKWHTTREASCRRAFGPCAPILFVLYHYFEQNLHFGLVPAPPQVLSARSILVAGFDTCNIPNRHISSRSKKFCTGVAKKWRFPERKWHQFRKKNLCARASLSSEKCDQSDASHFVTENSDQNDVTHPNLRREAGKKFG